MSAIHSLNPKAEVAKAAAALAVNISAAKGLQDVLKTNLGPKGALALIVGPMLVLLSATQHIPVTLQFSSSNVKVLWKLSPQFSNSPLDRL